MGDYKKLLEKGAGAVGLADDLELIMALGALVKDWAKLEEHLKKIKDVSSAEEFLTKFVTDIGNADVQKAFELAGMAGTHASLVKLLKKVTDQTGKVPDEIKRLLNPVSRYNAADAEENSGVVEWTPFDKTEKFGAGSDFTFELGGTAVLTLEAGDKVKIDETERRLLKIGAAVGVTAKAGGTAPFKPVKIEGKFQASGSADLAYHFDTGPGDPLYALAVAQRLPELPNPFDYESVWRAFASDAGLTRLTYRFKGESKANIELSAGNQVSFGPDLVADLALSISADFSRSGEHSLTLTAGKALTGPDGTKAREILAELKRERQSAEALALGLKVEIDASKAAKRVQTEVNKVVDKWDSLLKQIKPFLSPGTLIQTEFADLLAKGAERLIGNKGLRDAVTRDLRGVIGIDPSNDPELVKWLSEELTGSIDSARGVLSGEIDDAVEGAANRLGDRLPAFAQAEIREALKPVIESLIGKADEALKAKVGELFDTAREKLGEALKKAGVKAKKPVEDLDKALASVREVVDRFDKLIHDTVDMLGDSSKMKVSVSLQAEERRITERDYEIVGTFEANSEKARKVFHALTHGKASDLRELLAQDTPGDDFRLDPDRSKLRDYSKRTSGFGYEVVIFGFAASGHDIATGEADVVLSGNGTVKVDSKATISKLHKGRRESREVSLVEGFALLRAKIDGAVADRNRALDLAVSVTHHDESLKLGEMMGFLNSLKDRGLLPDDVSKRAREHFVRWAGKDDKNARLKADIAAKLWLGKTDAEKLMMLKARDGARLNRAGSIQVIKTALKAVFETDALNRISKDRFDDAVGFVRDRIYRGDYPKSAPREEILWDMLTPSERNGAPTPGELDESWKGQLPTGGGLHLRADVEKLLGEGDVSRLPGIRGQFHNLVQMIDLMGQIYLAQPAGLGEASPLGWDQPKYQRKQFELAQSGRGWLKVGAEFLFWIDDKVQPWTVAFMATMAELARGSREGAVSLTLTRRAVGEVQAETVELAKGQP